MSNSLLAAEGEIQVTIYPPSAAETSMGNVSAQFWRKRQRTQNSLHLRTRQWKHRTRYAQTGRYGDSPHKLHSHAAPDRWWINVLDSLGKLNSTNCLSTSIWVTKSSGQMVEEKRDWDRDRIRLYEGLEAWINLENTAAVYKKKLFTSM